MLVQIIKESGTDKYSHGYAPVYQEYLSHLKDEKFQLCDIGVLKGNSLKAWNRYFTNADIHGFDLMRFPKVGNIPVHKMDQCDKEEMGKLVKELKLQPTIIVEDGGHKPEHHQKTIYPFFKAMKSGGIYFIEDLQVCFHGKKPINKKYEVTPENNTIDWLNSLLTETPMQSPYLSAKEQQYLINNIESIEFRTNGKLAIIKKK